MPNNFKKLSDNPKLKVNFLQWCYYSIMDRLNKDDPFYSSPLQAKKLWLKLEADLEQYKFSENFNPANRFIFTDLIKMIKKVGWSKQSALNEKKLDYLGYYKDSLILNGYKNIAIEKLVSEDEVEVYFIDKDMSDELKTNFKNEMEEKNARLRKVIQNRVEELKFVESLIQNL